MGNESRQLPTGLSRLFLRAPVYLYKARLGWVLGGRFLLLHHVGRRSGLPRETVIEVVRHDPATNAYVICSGFGEKAQWFQNIVAQPDLRIQVGNMELAVHAERPTPDQAAFEMLDYARRHPRAAKKLAGYMGFSSDGSEATYKRIGREMPFLRLRPRHRP